MKTKKAQGLSMQTIVLAVLALAVLIILIIIFSGKSRSASDFMNDCGSVDGTPLSWTDGEDAKVCPEGKPYKHPLYRSNEGDTIKICCVESLIPK